MKKVILIIGIIIFLFLLTIIVAPSFFKGPISKEIKKAANENLNGNMNFEDISLSFLKNFPDFTLGIENLVITNQAPFEGDTLAKIRSFDTRVDLISLISGDVFEIISITLEQPIFNLHVLKDGTPNWDLAKETESEQAKDTSGGSFNFALQSYTINSGQLFYQDQSSDMIMFIKDLNHSGSGDLSQDVFSLDTKTKLNLTVEMENVTYVNDVNMSLDAEIAMDLQNMKFTLKENKLQFKNISLTLDGSILMPDEEIDIDLVFQADKTEFKDVISLMPALYAKDFDKIKTAGQFKLNGSVKGIYSEKKMPGFNLNFFIENGMVQYPDIPTPINDINVEMVVNNPGNDMDKTEINIKKLHFAIDKEPFDAAMFIKTPISDLYVDATITGKINLTKVNNLLALEEGTKIGGFVNSNMKIKGYPSAIEKNQTNRFTARGGVTLTNIKYSSKEMPDVISVPSGKLTFNPKNVVLDHLNVQIGKSDLKANGQLRNFIPYVLKDQTLSGRLNISSNYFDLNPWMLEKQESGSKGSEGSATTQTTELPDKIEFVINANCKKVIYEDLELKNVTGNITFKNKTINLDNLKMNVLNGSVVANGSYNAQTPQTPIVNFNLDIKKLSIPSAYEKFLTVKMFTPISQFIQGDFDARLNLKTSLDQTLTPDWNSLTSTGGINIDKANIKDFKPLNKIADVTKIDILKNPALNNIKSNFKIHGGRIHFSPFDVKMEDTNINISGSNGIDKSLDYTLKLAVPASKVQKHTSGLIQQLFKEKVSLSETEMINFDVFVTGTFDNPIIKTSLSDVLKSAIQKEIEKQKKDLLKDAENKILDLFKK